MCSHQVGLNGFTMTVSMYNQGHTRVAPMSIHKPRRGAHGIHPSTSYTRPLAERGLGLGVTQSLVLGTCPQLPLNYCCHILALDSQSEVQGKSLPVPATKEHYFKISLTIPMSGARSRDTAPWHQYPPSPISFRSWTHGPHLTVKRNNNNKEFHPNDLFKG